jgi:hypothetical protein
MGSPANDQEETLFLRVLGTKSPFLRILDFLMDNKAYDYTKIDIAKGAGISRRDAQSRKSEDVQNIPQESGSQEIDRAG